MSVSALHVQLPQAPQYTGPGSCASATCHGSVSPRSDNRVLQNEYSTWISRDKHSKAYTSLTGATGERMAAILGLKKAETAPKCLACHALDVPASERARTFDLSEGVVMGPQQLGSVHTPNATGPTRNLWQPECTTRET